MSSTLLTRTLNQSRALKKRFREAAENKNAASLNDSSLSDNEHRPEELISEILSWIRKSTALGAYVYTHNDRRVLQARINDWTVVLHRYGHSVEDSTLAPADLSAGLPLNVECPYPGLKAYDESFELIGRVDEVKSYCLHLQRSNFLSVVGGSGTGKSSIVLAGVLPTLRSTKPFNSNDWTILPAMMPGPDPKVAFTNSLKTAFKTQNSVWIAGIEKKISGDISAFIEHLELRAQPSRLIVVIDQFEELFSVCEDPISREHFAQLLLALLKGKNKIIITMRTDYQYLFEDNLLDLYSQMMPPNYYTPAPLGFQQLKDVIEVPAQKVGLRFVPPTLVDEYLAVPTARQLRGLPLLQYSLQKLWKNRPKKDGVPLDIINAECFAKLPSLEQALGVDAQSLYNSITDQQGKDICKRALLEMVVLADFGEPLRRRRSESELVQTLTNVFSSDSQPRELVKEKVTKIIGKWVDADLWVRSGTETGTQIDIAHEALLRHWAEFLGWFDSAKTDLAQRKTIESEVRGWMAGNFSRHLLKLRGESLKEALRLKDELWLDPNSIKYVGACEEEQDRIVSLQKQTEDLEAAQIESEKKITRLSWGAAVVVLISSVIIFGVSRYFKSERTEMTSLLSQLQSNVSSFEFYDIAKTLAAKDDAYDSWKNNAEMALPYVKARLNIKDIFHISADGSVLTGFTRNFRNRENSDKNVNPGKLFAINLDLDVLKDIDYSGEPNSISADAELFKSSTSGASADGLRTIINVFKIPDSATKDRFLINLVRTSITGKGAPVLPKNFELAAQDIGDLSFNSTGTRVLLVARNYPSENEPPVTSLVAFDFSQQEGWIKSTRLQDAQGSECFISPKLYSAALIEDNPCPATTTNEFSLRCPDSDNNYNSHTGPGMVRWMAAGADQYLWLYDGSKLYAWNCGDNVTKAPVLLAAGSVSSASMARRDGKVHAVAVVDDNILCWVNDQSGWMENPCLINTRANYAVLADQADRMRLIPEYNEIKSKVLIDVPYVSVDSPLQPLRPLKPDAFFVANGPTVVMQIPQTEYQQPGLDLPDGGQPQNLIDDSNKSAVNPDSDEGAPDDTELALEKITIKSIDPDATKNSQVLLERPRQDLPWQIAVSADGDWIAYTDLVDGSNKLRVSPNPAMTDLTPVSQPDNLNLAFGLADVSHLAISSQNGVPKAVFYSSGKGIKGWEYKDNSWSAQPLLLDVEMNSGVSCLAVSKGGKYLAIGQVNPSGLIASSGKVIDLENVSANMSASTSINSNYDDKYKDVYPCAVSDKGEAVFGVVTGDILAGTVTGVDSLTSRPGQSLPEGIKQISISDDGTYVAVLAGWKNQGCGLPAMPGQFISLWKSDDKSWKSQSRKCQANTPIQAISMPYSQEGEKVNLNYLSGEEIIKYELLPGKTESKVTRELEKTYGSLKRIDLRSYGIEFGWFGAKVTD